MDEAAEVEAREAADIEEGAVELERAVRIRSALVGYFLGDCWGAPYEFGHNLEGRVDRRLRKSVFGHEPGRGTDDTELALAAGRAVLEDTDDGPVVVKGPWLRELFAWQDTRPRDIGASTSASLADWRGGRDPAASVQGRQRAGNGALIVATVPALAHLGFPPRAQHEAGLAASFTHPHPMALRAARLYGWLLAGGELEADDAEWLAKEGNEGGIGYAPKCLLIAFKHAQEVTMGGVSPDAALRACIERGGDTDTNGAMCGALIGALTGCEWPTDLVDQLDAGRLAEVEKLARALAGAR